METTQTAVDVTCPHCGFRVSVSSDNYAKYQGKRSTCRQCKNPFIVGETALVVEQQQPVVSVDQAMRATQTVAPPPQYQCSCCAGWFDVNKVYTVEGGTGYICRRCHGEQNRAPISPPVIHPSATSAAMAPPPPLPYPQQSVVVNNIVHPVAARRWNPGIAAVLSVFWPGLGQIYKGQVINGLVWMVVVFIGYLLLVVPGLILHVCCIIGAAMGDPYR
jgi:TM2 domain-containing membrane protein YozV